MAGCGPFHFFHFFSFFSFSSFFFIFSFFSSYFRANSPEDLLHFDQGELILNS